MVKEIDISDSDEWMSYVSDCISFDFYHTYCYYSLEKPQGHNAILFVVEMDNNFVAFPLIIRRIAETEYFDCTSAYGYCGPISNLPFQDMPQNLIAFFQSELCNFFKRKNIVTAFSRLHPIFDQEKVFSGIGLVKDVNKTIAIDLSILPEEQRRQYRKSNKSEINQLRKKGFQIIEASTKKEIDVFISIYHETMKRVDASDNYFFSQAYFDRFLNNSCFQVKLLLAVKENEITAGAIFTFSNKIMQYHLAGTTAAFIKDTPMKLILDEARLVGNDLNMQYLHLGGGVGGSDQDSLFKFKAGFSNTNFMFKVWQYIVDQEKYDQLNQLFGTGLNKTISYFPIYRFQNVI